MMEDSAELPRCLAKGWAVASPTVFDTAYNGELTDDDLIFNIAALYALRHIEEFDRQRLAHEGVDDTVYASPALYRQEVMEELGQC